ncbi:hypothetical protein COCC4DRAFT_64934 [Bipolaris maydis ATCC 48331]|uniref:Uncharacterized protein n=2 Tax=Cochliobolus heterostrophus TaxID=5016 RepID=M2UGP0_COCH5|nr:uncharacterized protein COCC4DRAFT_64934 [Bipolaris maydis ATCC 48331]EMD97609.1 hypothetical protein COCHEDRAFT_1025997 [Bipolaris maydis C5]ENI01107.1 hypothetical protein COCC4DRAFT_64934 [Bipolaris maydis ATCC 48331]
MSLTLYATEESAINIPSRSWPAAYVGSNRIVGAPESHANASLNACCLALSKSTHSKSTKVPTYDFSSILSDALPCIRCFERTSNIKPYEYEPLRASASMDIQQHSLSIGIKEDHRLLAGAYGSPSIQVFGSVKQGDNEVIFDCFGDTFSTRSVKGTLSPRERLTLVGYMKIGDQYVYFSGFSGLNLDILQNGDIV